MLLHTNRLTPESWSRPLRIGSPEALLIASSAALTIPSLALSGLLHPGRAGGCSSTPGLALVFAYAAAQGLDDVERPVIDPGAVLNVDTAALSTFIGAGGLGRPIKGMLGPGRPTGTLVAAAVVAALALVVDWLAGLAEYAVRRSSG